MTAAADDVAVDQTAPWEDEPWRVVRRGADSPCDRLRAGFNAGGRLQTETVNAVAAGLD